MTTARLVLVVDVVGVVEPTAKNAPAPELVAKAPDPELEESKAVLDVALTKGPAVVVAFRLDSVPLPFTAEPRSGGPGMG